MKLTPAQADFMRWLRDYDTAIYEVAKQQLRDAGLKANGLGQYGPLRTGYVFPGATPPIAPKTTSLPTPRVVKTAEIATQKTAWDKFTDSLTNSVDAITSTIQKTLPTYQKLKVDHELFKRQLERAKKGLPPIPVAPANPQELSHEEKIVVTQEAAKAGLTESQPGIVRRLMPALPWIGGGLLLWAATRKKTGR